MCRSLAGTNTAHLKRMKKKEHIIETLKTIKDPEVDIDIYTLGLIYDIAAGEEEVVITMTLTSPLCPFSKTLPKTVRETLQPHAERIIVNVTFDPPWQPSEELRKQYGV